MEPITKMNILIHWQNKNNNNNKNSDGQNDFNLLERFCSVFVVICSAFKNISVKYEVTFDLAILKILLVCLVWNIHGQKGWPISYQFAYAFILFHHIISIPQIQQIFKKLHTESWIPCNGMEKNLKVSLRVMCGGLFFPQLLWRGLTGAYV